MPKIKCTILLEQLYCMYYNTKPKSAQNKVTIVCFHPSTNCPKSISSFCNQIACNQYYTFVITYVVFAQINSPFQIHNSNLVLWWSWNQTSYYAYVHGNVLHKLNITFCHNNLNRFQHVIPYIKLIQVILHL
jgi:hypothetical protein